jgi:hypothetical protein
MPHKGTLTAWQQVIGKVVPARYVYEFDLKDFFGSVSLMFIRTLLYG